ncbi:MAG: RNA polymerase sigma factor [Oscillospiraceae bacterium]|jgi:RNA polymerase sigma-70 factor (ECF subfamily)|nr:RNA polymerase sigma factor [Oscillospiraceae bacterium]
MPDDSKLIRLIKQGDKQAFDTLVRRHYPNILAFCCRRIGNRATAEDLTQDVFLKLVAAIYKYRAVGKFSNFLFTIAANTCNDFFRKKTPALSGDDIEEQADSGGSPEDTLIGGEQAKQLYSQLRALPDMQREALILHYFHGLKAKDIAEIQGVVPATAKSRIKQGLDKLRKAYKEDMGL